MLKIVPTPEFVKQVKKLANSSIPTGKSGGFRVVTYYFDENNIVRLLLIYSKTEKENISDRELDEILKKGYGII